MDNIWLLSLGAIVFGAIVGSFLTMLAVRLPKIVYTDGSSFWQAIHQLSYPKSHCDSCEKPLYLGMLVPVVSFLRSKGCCGFCGVKIARSTLVIELLAIILALSLVWLPLETYSPWTFLALFVLFSAFIVLSVIDFNEGVLPDELTLPLLWLGMVVNLNHNLVDLSDAVIGAIFAYGSLWLIYQIHFLLTKKEGLGFGDFKLFAVVGAWFGWQILPLVLLLASVLALLFVLGQKIGMKKDMESVAFGPFIAAATFVAFPLNSWWWSLAL